MHDLLARDQDGGLVLLGAMPSNWLQPDKITNVVNLPTNSGTVSVNFRATATGGILSWNLALREGADAPKVRFPLPASVTAASVTGDAVLDGRDVVMTGTSGTVGLNWTGRTPEPGPSMDATLERLRGEYRALKLIPPR